MKKMNKIMGVLFTFVMMVSVCSMVFALPEGLEIKDPAATGKHVDIATTVLGYIRFIGYAIAIGMILYIGIKYMMSSAADKADLKKGAINYVIGAFLVAGATTIVSMLMSINF